MGLKREGLLHGYGQDHLVFQEANDNVNSPE